MKKVAALLLVTSLFTLELALEGAAQSRATAPAVEQPPSPTSAAPAGTVEEEPGLHEASIIVGTRVKNAPDRHIGE